MVVTTKWIIMKTRVRTLPYQ